jgi:large subunit ribosomal protein L25
MSTKLKGTARDAGKNLISLRAEGLVPAVVYGAKENNASIAVPMREFMKVLKEAGESGTVELELPTGTVTVLIHEVTNDPVKDTPQHVDFLAIDVNKPIQVTIPLEFVGVSPAVKGSLGTLVKVMHEIEVKGLPKDVPHSITVDISTLDVLDSHISVGHLGLPKGVEAMAKDTDIVVSIASIKEESEEPAGPIDFSAIEVEKKGKKEEEGAEAAK